LHQQSGDAVFVMGHAADIVDRGECPI
jgi:hypothetical protein